MAKEFGGTSYAGLDDEFERLQAIDERAEDRRPATLRIERRVRLIPITVSRPRTSRRRSML